MAIAMWLPEPSLMTALCCASMLGHDGMNALERKRVLVAQHRGRSMPVDAEEIKVTPSGITLKKSARLTAS